MDLATHLLETGFTAYAYDAGSDFGWALVKLPVTYAAFGFAASDRCRNVLNQGKYFAIVHMDG